MPLKSLMESSHTSRRTSILLNFTLLLGRPNKAGLRCPYARPYVHLYARPSTKRFFDFSEIRLIHDVMQYDPIQGQGHELLKFGNSTIFKGHLLPHL